MPVTSSTIGGVNTWTFSGSVTDAELKAAWAGLIVNGVYVLNRAIYLDNTADLTGCTGGFLVDLGTQVNPGFILHTGRDKTKSTFRNFTFLQREGLSVTNRGRFVLTWNGTTLIAPSGADGLSQNGGGTIYGVPGNPGGGDPRYLNEMSFAGLEGVTIYSQEFTEQELQIIISQTTQLKGITFEKCYGFPQIGTTVAPVNVAVYRSNQNTQSTVSGGLIPIRLFPSNGRYASVCYVDSYITRNNSDINTRLIDTFGANASNVATIMVLNNYTRESWFGASKTNIPVTASWTATNIMLGGVLKKLRFIGGDGATIRAYDSRSTTVAQKCSFQETGTSDFLNASTAPTTDSNGQISLVHIGAIAQGAGAPITRYTNQRYTFQKFGYRVLVNTVDMTQGGDNDLSAFTPVIPVAQEGITRTQAAITAATSIDNFQQLLEEIHVLSLGLFGAASYSGAFTGNLASFAGGVLTTNFASVTVDKTAASKIAYDSAANTLVIRSDVLTDTETVQRWNNPTGTINLLNGAKITGVYTTSAGTSTSLELRNIKNTAAYIAANATTKATILYGVNTSGSSQDYTIYFPPGSAGTSIYVARKALGDFFDFEVLSLVEGSMWYTFTDIPDEGTKETDPAILNAYTSLETNTKFYNYLGLYQTTEEGIKLGRFIIREGNTLKWAAPYSAKVNQGATALFSKAGDLFTIKATGLAADANYDTHQLTGTGILTADSNEVLTTEIIDANGDSSLTIQGGSGSYEIWKVPNGTPEDNYAAVGTVLASNVGLGKWRFTGVTGFYILVRDKAKNNRDTCSMEQGTYTIGLYAGKDQITVAQLPEVYELKDNLALLQIDVGSVMGTGFNKDTHSLTNIRDIAAVASTNHQG